MSLYTAQTMGWMAVIEADNHREAVSIARAMAPGASLLESDITSSCVAPSTDDDVRWYQSMGGRI